jgi:hypothetical protein
MPKTITLLIVLQFIYGSTFNYTIAQKQPEGSSYCVGFLPSKKKSINGIAIGLFGSETICSLNGIRTSNGLNWQIIGNGGFLILAKQFWNIKLNFGEDSVFTAILNNDENLKTLHNGLIISTLGTNTSISNGIAISSLVSNGLKLNGIGLNVLSNNYMISNGITISIINRSYKTSGIQIGIINKSKYLKGLQLGLWNVNSKRKLPFINWGY